MAKLSASQEKLFRGVGEAAFANPFGERRAQIDAELAGMSASADRDSVIDALLLTVRKELTKLGTFDVEQVPAKMRRVVQLTVLFDVFHRHAEAFDDLIRRQALAGKEPVEAKFGAAIVRELQRFGFGAERSERMVAILYQVRRAFYFIKRSLPGESPCMQRLRMRVWQNIFTDDLGLYESALWARMEDFSVFLHGETGTGKGTAAAAIGRAGWIAWDARRARFAHGFDDGFVSINLSQYPETLIESELFGHRKGAFTGAMDAYDGVLARCRPHGTIFMDEIGEVSEPVQIKLLRVLQEREFSPVGSHEHVRFRGRVMAATHRSPAELRASGKMREDFYYRLCSDVIEVPPLRQRIAEAPGELDQLVTKLVARTLGAEEPEVVSRVLDVISSRLGPEYAWPGNVRELEQCVRRVLVTQDYQGQEPMRPDAEIGKLRISADELVSRYCQELYAQIGSYEGVGRIVELDRRTVKRHVESAPSAKAE